MIDRVSHPAADRTDEVEASSHDLGVAAEADSRKSVGVGRELKMALGDLAGHELELVEERLRQAVRSRFDAVDELSHQLPALGGKRLRPLLVLLSARSIAESGGRCGESEIVDLAAAVELVHAASLVHDDVLDDADRRRHQPTVHAVAGVHRAVLLGDFLFTRAYGLAANCRSPRPARLLAAAATQLCEGEMRQQASIGRFDLPLREYRSILVQKTAALCAVSCRLGAWSHRATRAQVRALRRYGVALGLAFQIHDDWLDYWGDTQTGKTLGTDLEQAKPTLPLLHFLGQVDVQQRQRCLATLKLDNNSASHQLYRQIQQSPAKDFTLNAARRQAMRAQQALKTLPHSPARQCLARIAQFSVRREC